MIEIEARLSILYKQSPASRKDDILLMVPTFGWHVKRLLNKIGINYQPPLVIAGFLNHVFNSIPVAIYDLFCP